MEIWSSFWPKRGYISERKIGIYIMSRDGEIVGLKGVTNGGSCKSHNCCGYTLDQMASSGSNCALSASMGKRK